MSTKIMAGIIDVTNLLNEKNDFSETIDIRFVSKMNSEFTEIQQKWYLSNFYIYLNHHPTNDFVINLDDIWKFIGFANKGNAKRTLENNFNIDTDYIIRLFPTEKPKNKGGNKETILLNTDTFKNLCMIAKTEEGKEIRSYYIKLENIHFDLIKEELQILKNENHQIIKEKQQIEETLHNLKTYVEVNKPEGVYINSTDKPGIYKNGKIVKTDPKTRNSALQVGCVDPINTLLYVDTVNSTVLENLSHYLFREYRVSGEHFACDLNYMKKILTLSGNFLNTLASCKPGISDEELATKLYENVGIKIHTCNCIKNENGNYDSIKSTQNTIDSTQKEYVVTIQHDSQKININTKTPDECEKYFEFLKQNIEYVDNKSTIYVLKMHDILQKFKNETYSLAVSNGAQMEEMAQYKELTNNYLKIAYPTVIFNYTTWKSKYLLSGKKSGEGYRNLKLK